MPSNHVPAEIRKYLALKKEGYRYLRRGFLFLLMCLACGQGIHALNIPFGDVITESLTVVGWVALWKPLEIFLYELPELKKRCKKCS